MMVPIHSQGWDSGSGEPRPECSFTVEIFLEWVPTFSGWPASSVKWEAGCSSLPALKSNAVISPSAICQQLTSSSLWPSSQSSVSCCPEEVSDWCGAASVDSLVTFGLIYLSGRRISVSDMQSSRKGVKPGLIVQWIFQDKSSLSSGPV